MTRLTRVGPDDVALDAWCALFAAWHEADTGDRTDADLLRRAVRAHGPASGAVRWLAQRDGAAAGVALLRGGDGGSWAFLRLYVAPAHRRQGVGTALLEQVSPGAAVRAVVTAGGAGEGFATAAGATVLLRLAELVQTLPAGGPELPGHAPALPTGHRLVLWQEAAPEPLLPSYAAAKTFIADAPGAGLQVDPAWTPSRIRAWEASLRAQGRTAWGAAVLLGPAVVAFTELSTDDGPHAAQHDTVVVPGHRRRGLGTAVKSALVAHVQRHRPDVTEVRSTVNAENAAVVALDRRLGYRVARHRLLVELARRTP